ncbi:hypothetical protein C1H46_013828 [Malus baccata]|uniref:Uncharacterized protein n=1 Tax=Malus baccata TaxID=106549 RepID=A0A540MP73_MALBA|nr:hypothetical protein C1H46_013828 [Malus baccata]
MAPNFLFPESGVLYTPFAIFPSGSLTAASKGTWTEFRYYTLHCQIKAPASVSHIVSIYKTKCMHVHPRITSRIEDSDGKEIVGEMAEKQRHPITL